MLKTEKRKTGDLGEDVAAMFLMKQGFRIVERNYLRKWGEIDIIAKKNGTLCFVEVKTVTVPVLLIYESNMGLRKPTVFGFSIVPYETLREKFFGILCFVFLANTYGYLIKEVTHETSRRYKVDSFRPEDNLHSRKLERLRRTIQTYFAEKRVSEESEWRFDAICVYLNEKEKRADVEHIKDIIL